MNPILIYFLVGFVVGFFLWHNICSNQSEEEKREDNPGVIIVLPCLILLWPIGLASYIRGKFS